MNRFPDPPANSKPADHAARIRPFQLKGVFCYVGGGFIQMGFVTSCGDSLEIHTGLSDRTRGQFALGPVFTSYEDFWASII